MNNIEYQTRQLIREIKKSNIYNQYRRLQTKIEKDQELYRRVNEFRKACFVIQNKPNGPGDTGELYALYETYDDILMNSDVRELLTAEHGMSMLMNQVMEQIYGNLDIDVSFLDS